MATKKHMTLEDRIIIETSLKDKDSFKTIAGRIGKNPTSVSREIRSLLIFRRVGSMHNNYNACAHRSTCTKHHICTVCHSERKFKLCKRCTMCNAFCGDFEEHICSRLLKPPYVCNGCSNHITCTLEKRFYKAPAAHAEYYNVLSESRSGISFSEDEIRHLDEMISPLIRQNQSPHHICVSNNDSIMVSERTIYRLIVSNLFSARNIDLPRKVRFSARKVPAHFKIDKSCRIRRDYNCFLSFLEKNPDSPITQLDSVVGKRGGAVLLTIHFVKAEMMLAFLREYNDSNSVIRILDELYHILTPELFCKTFKVCLTDNGSEFSNPKVLEFDKEETRRAHIFYCNPSAPYQKGSAERNHEFIRYFIPKGAELSAYSQDDISLMMDHINSYKRESLGNRSPYEMFSFLYGEDLLKRLECHPIHLYFVRRFVMKIDRNTIDYKISMDNLRWMEAIVPMTLSERLSLRSWVMQGNDIESNPWDYLDFDEMQLNYLEAFLLENGYSSGPWDYWRGPENQPFWDNEHKTFISRNDYC